jgi:hypothetical protein
MTIDRMQFEDLVRLIGDYSRFSHLWMGNDADLAFGVYTISPDWPDHPGRQVNFTFSVDWDKAEFHSAPAAVHHVREVRQVRVSVRTPSGPKVTILPAQMLSHHALVWKEGQLLAMSDSARRSHAYDISHGDALPGLVEKIERAILGLVWGHGIG